MGTASTWSRRKRAIVTLWVSSVTLLVLLVILRPFIGALVFAYFYKISDSPAETEKTEVVDLAARPSMETMVARYQAVEKTLVADLDSRFGAKRWYSAFGDTEVSRGGCGETEDPSETGETVSLPLLTFDGVYPKAVWGQVLDLVIDVAEQNGFTEIISQQNKAWGLNFAARDVYGARLDFGLGKNAVLDVETGCHRWQHPPYTPPPLDLESP